MLMRWSAGAWRPRDAWCWMTENGGETINQDQGQGGDEVKNQAARPLSNRFFDLHSRLVLA